MKSNKKKVKTFSQYSSEIIVHKLATEGINCLSTSDLDSFQDFVKLFLEEALGDFSMIHKSIVMKNYEQ